MAKSFLNQLKNANEKKAETNLKTENDRLRDDKRKLQEKVTELQNVLKQSDNGIYNTIASLKLSQIKIGSNIRDDEYDYKYEDIQSLAENILEFGQLQPVLISEDKYLIAGYRRFRALSSLAEKNKNYDEILAYTYNKKLGNISYDELVDIQLSENNQRKDIDNFQLSLLYNQLLGKGHTQQQLADRFKKTKSFISMVVSVENIEPELVDFLKQFQIYGWSEEKFNMLNVDKTEDEKLLKEYEKLKGNIGIIKLSNIAKYESKDEQKKAFIKLYGNRLSANQLNSSYFKNAVTNKSERSFNEKGLKHIDGLGKLLESDISSEFKNTKEYESIKNKVKELEKLFRKLFKE